MVHEPHGVVALLVPWNDPLAIAGQGLAAALVTGNTVVLKPSERTPLATARLVELLDLPAGAVTLLLGDERAGRPLVEHEDVDCVLHTGSTDTGREIAQACAAQLKKAVVELGGKDPLIVDAGVDPEWAAAQAATGAFANAGQICTAATVLTADQAHAQRAWRELHAGTVKVNAVFGGAPGGAAHPRRASGLGLGYGPELLDELTQVKVVHLEPAPARSS